MQFWQVDVFADRPLAGNGLAVFPDARGLSEATMLALTRELRQFETIFLTPTADATTLLARVFTMEEELPFAGHPVLGAAGVLHHFAPDVDEREWLLQLPQSSIPVRTSRDGGAILARMTPGGAQFGTVLSEGDAEEVANAFSTIRDPRYPAQVVSTGLPYLLLPVTRDGLERAKQLRSVQERLKAFGAAFVYLADVDSREGRTWDPFGDVEDIATGSAAAPFAAYLVRYASAPRGQEFILHQGRFVGRPSRMAVSVSEDGRVTVGGRVQFVASASLIALPPESL